MQTAISNISTILTAMLGWITDIFEVFMANEFIGTFFYFTLGGMIILFVLGLILAIVNNKKE